MTYVGGRPALVAAFPRMTRAGRRFLLTFAVRHCLG